jgi:serine/threonine protein kinase
MTGKTPFVVQGPKEDTKKIIEKNILDVNITFPNDFPILAKSFILGMVKRKPEERITLKELMNHEWLLNTQ